MNTNTHTVWFITGAGKGLGAAIAREALDNGYTVVAAARNPETARKALGESTNCLGILRNFPRHSSGVRWKPTSLAS